METLRNIFVITLGLLPILNVYGQTIDTEEIVLSFENITSVEVTKNFNDKEIPFWSTTSSDELIELWVDGTADISASDGKYFVELNATEIASIYFDIKTDGYDTLKLSFDHRARLSGGFDEIEILSSYGEKVLKSFGSFKSDNQKWNTITIAIPIEKDHEITRIVFKGLSTVSDDPTIGNFIDNVRLSLKKSVIEPETVTIKIYPNPFVDYIIVDPGNSKSNFEFNLYTMQGELKKQQQFTSQTTINLQELKSGLFISTILDTSTKIITQTKIIKN